MILGANLIWPEESDKFTKMLFSDKDPLVRALSHLIILTRVARFQRSSLKPMWVDVF
jgi:hypothetical protein